MMNFSLINQLSLYFLLCLQGVSSSADLHSKNEGLSNFDVGNAVSVLEKFFVELSNAYLFKRKTRHVTFVGGSSDDLRQAQPMLENYPYIICKETDKCRYSNVFSRGSIVVLFLKDLSEEAFAKKDKLLMQCRRCKIFFISDRNIEVHQIRLIFTLSMARNLQYVEFAHVRSTNIKLYSNFFGKNCSVEVRLIAIWKPGFDLDKIHTWAFQLLKDLSGCPISISSLNFRPKMMITETANGSLVVVGGREGKLLLTLAEKLNFTLAVRYPTVVEQLKFSRKTSVIMDVISGIVEVGIGRILPNNDLHEMLAFSISYDEECITWGVPLVINWSSDILLVEFSWEVWLPVSLVFIVICVIGYLDRNFNPATKGKRRGIGLFTIALDDLAVHLGNPVVHISSSAGGRFMLIVYLYYILVITTAYKSYLSAILVTSDGTPLFVDVEGLIKENITVGGSLYDYKILEEQVNASELTAKLIQRFVINNNDAETLHRLKYHHDYAFLARLSLLNYQKQNMVRNHERLSFDILNGCVLDYYTVIIFKKISFLRKPTNNIIKRLREAGLLEHWDFDEMYPDKIFKDYNSGKYFENNTNFKFRTMFILYCGCIAVSLLVFVIELLCANHGF